MSVQKKAPRVQIEVGDRKRFAIGVVLPALSPSGKNGTPDDYLSPTRVLEITDGYVTFWVGGVNVLRIDSSQRVPDALRYYSSVCLSMLLEWVYLDRAFDLTEGKSRSLSEIVNGEATPDLRFKRTGECVAVEWDFENRTRNGCPFHSPKGAATIDYASYLFCLATLVDDLTAAIGKRSRLCGAWDVWQKWLDGYAEERQAFERCVDAEIAAGNIAKAVAGK